LILETGPGVIELGMPAGEGVASGDWDGTVRSTQATPFIPLGLSLWELSVDSHVGTKADKDYKKRTTTPDGSPTADCTYVEAILRRWNKRTEWANDRTAEGRWKTVRATGVDGIESWLESAPVTHAWISEQLGYSPHGLRSAETWWEGWSAATTPAIPVDLVLCGRKDEADALLSRLTSHPQISTVKAGSLQEILAFIAAVGKRADTEGAGQILARTVFVDDLVAWRTLLEQQSPLVLIPRGGQLKDEIPAGTHHHIVVPVVGAADADIELPPIDAAQAIEVLKKQIGLDEQRAEAAGRLARRSLLALRRNLANKPELHEPAWATPPVDRVVRGILLAGGWSDSRAADQAVLASLTGMDYESLRERLADLAAHEDPLVAFVDGSWSLVSPYDAWLLLRSQLREDDLSRLKAAVDEVLGEADPGLGIPADQRWRAFLDGKVHAYSEDLRRGLAASLALLGTHGERVNAGAASNGTVWAAVLVRDVLERANADQTAHLWPSLSRLLSLLAEAAPDAFLDAVRAGVQGSSPPLAAMFTDNQVSMFGSNSPHSGLLWALETVAWSPEHFGQAIDLLARLAEIDPGGQLANRPFESLANIFCPWFPENSVDVKRRLAVIDGLRQRHADVAWRLMLELLPERAGAMHLPTSEPAFRDWKPPRTAVTRVEYLNFVREMVRRLLDDARDLPDRWRGIIEEIDNLPAEDRELVRTELTRLADAKSLLADGQAELWEALRSLIARHREFAGQGWALPGDELSLLEAITQRFAPALPATRHAWLFQDYMPDLGDPLLRDDIHAHDARLTELRSGAVSEIEASGGLDAVSELVRQSKLPWAVGVALADAVGDKYETELPDLVRPEHSPDTDFALAYMGRRFSQAGWSWMERFSARTELDAVQRARILLATRDFPRAWEVAETHGPDTIEAFWKFFSPIGLGPDFPHVAFVADNLLGVDRIATALLLLGIYLRSEQSDDARFAELVVTGLEALLVADVSNDPESRSLSQHDFERLFSYLEKKGDAVGADRVVRLEWAYLPALGHEPRVGKLNRLLADDPAFFGGVLSAVYRPHAEEEAATPTPERQRIAANGYRLLSRWSRVPGTREDGTLDYEALRRWVDEALTTAASIDRLEVSEIHIGRVLAFAPPDQDGTWPCVEVRNLLEHLQNERVERGLSSGIFSRRGMTTRGPEDGGGQELELAGMYRSQADQFADQWPRTAAVLRGLATQYESDARREESAAERDRRGLPD